MGTKALLACVFAALLSAPDVGAADRVGSGFSRSDSTRSARPAVPDLDPHVTLRFSPAPRSRCDWFLSPEAGIAVLAAKADTWGDRMLLTNGIGLLRNVGERDAVGAALELFSTGEASTLAPSLCWRRFLGPGASLGAAVGFVENKEFGVHGPVARVQYAPIPSVGVQAGVIAYRRIEWEHPVSGTAQVLAHERSDPAAFAGVNVTGKPAVLLSVAEALALATAFAIVMSGAN